MKLVRLIVIIAAISVTSERLTLQEVCTLYNAGLYDMHKFGKWAANYKRSTLPIGWGLLDHQAWIPFESGVFFNGRSSGTIRITIEIGVKDGVCKVKSRRIKSDLTTDFTPQPILKWPDPNEPNAIIVSPGSPDDPNSLIVPTETVTANDPNDPALLKLVELLAGDPNETM